MGDDTQNALLKIAQILNRPVDPYINLNPSVQNKLTSIPTPDEIQSHAQEFNTPKKLSLRVFPDTSPPPRARRSAQIHGPVSKSLSILVDRLKSTPFPPTATYHALNTVTSIETDRNHQAYFSFLLPKLNHIYNEHCRKLTLQKLLKGKEREKWLRALSTSLLDTKLILNSTIYDACRGAKFLSADFKDHFLASPMDLPEYMRIPLNYFSARHCLKI